MYAARDKYTQEPWQGNKADQIISQLLLEHLKLSEDGFVVRERAAREGF